MFSVGLSFWTDVYNSIKDTWTFLNEIADFTQFMTDFVNLVPSIFIIVLSLMLLIGLVFGVFHLVIVIFT